MINPCDYAFLARQFKEVFHLDLNKFFCAQFLIFGKAIIFDTPKFCDWLERKFPIECKQDGVSYADVVRLKFGEKGTNLIRRLNE